ncbi:MAG: hypothetical protein ACYS8Z_07360, partial [Planctomycetota bacterium]
RRTCSCFYHHELGTRRFGKLFAASETRPSRPPRWRRPTVPKLRFRQYHTTHSATHCDIVKQGKAVIAGKRLRMLTNGREELRNYESQMLGDDVL